MLTFDGWQPGTYVTDGQRLLEVIEVERSGNVRLLDAVTDRECREVLVALTCQSRWRLVKRAPALPNSPE